MPTTTRNEESRLLLSAKEAAEALNISQRTLFSLTASGELPAVRIGRRVAYDIADLRRYIETHKTMQ